MNLLDRIRVRIGMWLLRRSVTRITVSIEGLGASADEATAAFRSFYEMAEAAELRLGQQVAARAYLPADIAARADEIEKR